ncbi:MAG: PAS domain S-box protein, partial [Leptospiraceae bacterium]|nr:PAS domain S-box protein [Leptospiraceae bacterium]
DITEKVNTQIQIKESELKFKQMADNAPVMIWISGIDSLCTFFNKYWLDFTGKKLEEEMGDGWLRGVHLGDYDYCLKTYLDAFHSRKSFAMEYRIKRRDGQYRWILDHGVPNFDSEKNFLGYIGSCIDINPRKEFEEKIRSSLKEKEILLKEIHHRVKNNLQIISSLLSLQSSSLKDEKAIAALEDSIHRIRSIGLLHDMLNLAQDSMEIKLEDYISNISDSVMRIHDNFQIRLEKDFSKEKISISIDKAIYIGLIINELLSNSIKYAFREKEGIISVKTELIERNKVRLLYKDNGIGLPENFQLEENNSMGLKLVKMLIIQLGGEMNIIMDNGLHYDILIPLKEKQS